MKASTEAKKKELGELRAALAAGAGISSDTSDDTAEPTDAKPKRRTKRSTSRAPKKSSSSQTATTLSFSKQVAVSLYEEDHQVIRELAAFLSAQGLLVNRSLLIKAVLRAAKPNDELLEGYLEARSLDKRMKGQGE